MRHIKMGFGVDRNRLSCRGSNGEIFQNGRSFSIANDDDCSRCTCLAGKSRCLTVRCPKPTCHNYRKVAGQCCKFSCPDALPISDTKHLATVLTLSIVLLVILILIIIVWRRTRKYRRYASNIRTECATSDQDEIDSVSSNQRQSMSTAAPSMSSRTTVQLSTIEPPPYAPPKQPDPETITPCEPPPPYTPQDISFV